MRSTEFSPSSAVCPRPSNLDSGDESEVIDAKGVNSILGVALCSYTRRELGRGAERATPKSLQGCTVAHARAQFPVTNPPSPAVDAQMRSELVLLAVRAFLSPPLVCRGGHPRRGADRALPVCGGCSPSAWRNT